MALLGRVWFFETGPICIMVSSSSKLFSSITQATVCNIMPNVPEKTQTKPNHENNACFASTIIPWVPPMYSFLMWTLIFNMNKWVGALGGHSYNIILIHYVKLSPFQLSPQMFIMTQNIQFTIQFIPFNDLCLKYYSSLFICPLSNPLCCAGRRGSFYSKK